jgi:hypothetical protein
LTSAPQKICRSAGRSTYRLSAKVLRASTDLESYRPELEVLLRQDAIAQHKSGTRPNDVLSEEPCRELGSRFPDTWIQARVERHELRPKPHHPDSAIDSQGLPYHFDDVAWKARACRHGTQSAPVASPSWPLRSRVFRVAGATPLNGTVPPQPPICSPREADRDGQTRV